MTKTDAFIQLHKLINYYLENRDRPVSASFNFAQEFETYCSSLEVDKDEIKKQFNLVYFE